MSNIAYHLKVIICSLCYPGGGGELGGIRNNIEKSTKVVIYVPWSMPIVFYKVNILDKMLEVVLTP